MIHQKRLFVHLCPRAFGAYIIFYMYQLSEDFFWEKKLSVTQRGYFHFRDMFWVRNSEICIDLSIHLTLNRSLSLNSLITKKKQIYLLTKPRICCKTDDIIKNLLSLKKSSQIYLFYCSYCFRYLQMICSSFSYAP